MPASSPMPAPAPATSRRLGLRDQEPPATLANSTPQPLTVADGPSAPPASELTPGAARDGGPDPRVTPIATASAPTAPDVAGPAAGTARPAAGLDPAPPDHNRAPLASGDTPPAAAGGDATPTRQAVLALLLRHGEATASDLARHLSLSVQVMRRHLRSLGEEGLVEASPTPEGPGRPSNRWRLTPSGHGRFPDGGEDFALGLLQSLADAMPAEAMRQVLDQQAIKKALDYRRQLGDGDLLSQRLERLVDLRRQEGYVAECRPDPEQPGSWLISEYHCSVMRIAEAFPMVCDQELQLIRHTFPDCRIERVHWRLEEGHSCGFRLSPDPASP